MRKKFWDDFKVGEKLMTNGLTVTETHMVNFACLTGDFLPLRTWMRSTLKIQYSGAEFVIIATFPILSRPLDW